MFDMHRVKRATLSGAILLTVSGCSILGINEDSDTGQQNDIKLGNERVVQLVSSASNGQSFNHSDSTIVVGETYHSASGLVCKPYYAVSGSGNRTKNVICKKDDKWHSVPRVN